MSFRKLNQTRSIRPSRRYPQGYASLGSNETLGVLAIAAVAGLLAGVASFAATAEGRTQIAKMAGTMAVRLGVVRARTPQVGDYWPNCASARAAGTTPIYRGEPGYRFEMDGDSDGVACEPYRGMRR
ncbi:excalibur calcium-binding domain-containing protein [Sphingobium naphthae]|uniref:excalibur calcium-binding domain-containing protein n=1 Tax=Sphingobium naphthae TaxID=1886786 RepID=UPI0037488D31